jgi:phosphatidylserine/phosphatidylglycerophosphate/cardiolipin synthase-like enzyme
MSNQRGESVSTIIEQIRLLAADLSGDVTERVAHQLMTSPSGDWRAIRHRMDAVVSNARYRDRVAELIEIWQQNAPEVDPASVALALSAVAGELQASRGSQRIELVWTGPDSGAVPLRRTDQALLQIIEHSRADLLIVAFAVYKVPRILDAMNVAVRNGVRLQLILESSDEGEGKITFDTMKNLGHEVIRSAEIYVWPRELRMTDLKGRYGSLHVKCAVADEIELFVSSANLTEYALKLNMEMGVLVRGGSLPRQARQHFDRLIQRGTLVRVNS